MQCGPDEPLGLTADFVRVGLDAKVGPTARPMPTAQQHGFRRLSPAAPIDPEHPATWGKVPRNAPCPCGSGRKYKHCHGKLT